MQRVYVHHTGKRITGHIVQTTCEGTRDQLIRLRVFVCISIFEKVRAELEGSFVEFDGAMSGPLVSATAFVCPAARAEAETKRRLPFISGPVMCAEQITAKKKKFFTMYLLSMSKVRSVQSRIISNIPLIKLISLVN